MDFISTPNELDSLPQNIARLESFSDYISQKTNLFGVETLEQASDVPI